MNRLTKDIYNFDNQTNSLIYAFINSILILIATFLIFIFTVGPAYYVFFLSYLAFAIYVGQLYRKI
jgi:hypothetical protein